MILKYFKSKFNIYKYRFRHYILYKFFDFELKHSLFTKNTIYKTENNDYDGVSNAVLNPIVTIVYVINKLDINYSIFKITGIDFYKNLNPNYKEQFTVDLKTISPHLFYNIYGNKYNIIKNELEKEFNTTIHLNIIKDVCEIYK